MIWSRPIAFIGLAAIPLVFYFIAKSAKQKRAAIDAVFSDEMLARLAPPSSQSRVYLKNAFLILALVAFVLALAGPKFGRIEETTPSFGRDIFVLLDVSDSTLAEDVAPNRLTVAKLDVEDLLDAAVGDRVGLIAFAGSAQVEIPLTTDRSFFRELLHDVDTTTVKLGGTAIGDAIRLALSRFGTEPGRERAVVLVTDGEDWKSEPLEAARNAADAGVPIFPIAIGDLRGAKIPVFSVSGRRVGFKTFDGKEAISKPDVDTLKKIAKISGGKYFYANAALDLADVYKNSVDRQKRTRLDEKSRVVLKDQYRPFLTFGLIAFGVYYYLPTRKTSRPTQKRIAAASKIALLFAFFSTFAYIPSFAQDVKRQEAESDILKNKRSEIDAFNRSVDAINSGRNDEAFQTLTILQNARTPEVAGRANFNLGVDATRRLLETSRGIDEKLKSDANLNASSANVSANVVPPDALDGSNGATTESASEKPDAVALYEKERSERKSLQEKALQESSEATRRFGAAQANRSTRRESQEAADATIRWEETKRAEWSRAETDARARRLADPNDRLRWLRNETKRRTNQVAKFNATSDGVEFYRNLFNESRTLAELESDVADVAQKMGSNVVQMQNDADGVALINAAKDEFLNRERAAANCFRQYDATSGLVELRRAESELSAIQDVASPYEILLSQKVKEEEKTTKTFGASEIKTATPEELDEFVRSRKTLRRSVDELIRKAQKGSDLPIDDDVKNPNAEKIRESMKIAVERGKEIDPLIDEIQQLATASTRRDDAAKIADAQQKILEILKEIAKPLQDENQSNQNQQNESQNNQNSSQDQQNTDDKNQKKENGDSQSSENQDDQSNETPDELNEGKRADKELNDDSQDAQKPEQKAEEPNSESNDSENKGKTSQKADDELEKTEEQKKAEALTRQVVRRQKDAEAQRRAVRQALQKREKLGKDW